MYVRTEVETFGMIGRPYLCKRCGHRAQAWVVATGKAEAVGHGAGATSVAHDRAAQDGDVVATRSLMFAPCPQCNQLDPGASRYRWSRSALALAVMVPFAVAVGAIGTAVAVAMTGGFGALAGVRTYLYVRRPWAGAARRVSFDPPTS